jgi:hypothetical protein
MYSGGLSPKSEHPGIYPGPPPFLCASCADRSQFAWVRKSRMHLLEDFSWDTLHPKPAFLKSLPAPFDQICSEWSQSIFSHQFGIPHTGPPLHDHMCESALTIYCCPVRYMIRVSKAPQWLIWMDRVGGHVVFELAAPCLGMQGR